MSVKVSPLFSCYGISFCPLVKSPSGAALCSRRMTQGAARSLAWREGDGSGEQTPVKSILKCTMSVTLFGFWGPFNVVHLSSSYLLHRERHQAGAARGSLRGSSAPGTGDPKRGREATSPAVARGLGLASVPAGCTPLNTRSVCSHLGSAGGADVP